jgi:hypothetical protein
MKSLAYLLMISSLISLILVSFAFRDFSLMLTVMFVYVLIGLPLSTYLMIKLNRSSQIKFILEETDQDCELVNKFNINSY